MSGRSLALLAALAAAGEAQNVPDAHLPSGDHVVQLRHGGRERSYILHVPARAGRPWPVIVAFHGGGGDAAGFVAYAGLDAIADREGFVVVYPNGTGALRNRLLTWNAGDCCGHARNSGVDDVGFAVAVLDDVERRLPIDRARTFAVGHSNGAMMSYRLAAEHADRIAGVVAVGGAYNLPRLGASQPVAILHIHSVDDPRALYGGGLGPPFPGTKVRSSHRSVMEGLERWRKHNGCGVVTRNAETRRAGGHTATLVVWDGCPAAAPVRHWMLTGAGHGWPGAAVPAARESLIGPETGVIDAAEEAWRFLRNVRR